MKWYNKHLKETNQTYFQHGFFAIKMGGWLLIAAIASIIHGLFPWWFPFYSARSVVKMAKKARERHSEETLSNK